MTFDHSLRGFDPAEVHALLVAVAGQLERTQAELATTSASLAESRQGEDALRDTMVAMSEAREEILQSARHEAAQMMEEARREAAWAVARAEDEAAEIVMDARREALDVIAHSRRDADHLLGTAQATAAPLVARVEQLRAVTRRTENLMRGLASGALGELAQAHLMLDEAPDRDFGTMQIVFTDNHDHDHDGDDASVSPLPAAVDRLLSHLREIG